MEDPAENLRHACLKAINEFPRTRDELAAICGRVWDPDELHRDFEVRGVLAPLVFVTRSDGTEGTLLFQHWPRFYFRFQAKESR